MFQDKIDNDEDYYSRSFYTSPHMKIEVYTNGYGDGVGSHVSVFAYVIKGKFDDELNWPFVGKVTFELLEDKNHLN